MYYIFGDTRNWAIERGSKLFKFTTKLARLTKGRVILFVNKLSFQQADGLFIYSLVTTKEKHLIWLESEVDGFFVFPLPNLTKTIYVTVYVRKIKKRLGKC